MAIIRQDTEIAARIAEKEKSVPSLTDLLLSLTVEEWIVYLPALLHDTQYWPSERKRNFAMSEHIRFRYADTDCRGDSSYVTQTLRPFGVVADETAKLRLSKAVEKLIGLHLHNKKFLNLLLREMALTIIQGKKGAMSYSYESMRSICESGRTSVWAKKTAILFIQNGYCSGTPGKDALEELFVSCRDRFKNSDRLLCGVFRGFAKIGRFREAAETLPS